jgi:hypothetical protein
LFFVGKKVVFETVPTTFPGMRAKIDFAMSADHVTEHLTGIASPFLFRIRLRRIVAREAL